MDRRTHLVLLFAFVLARPSASLADDDEGSADESGGDESSGSDSGNSEVDDSADDDGDGEDGGASGDDDAPVESGGGAGAATTDHENALKAVQSEGVLSLEAFLQHFHQQVEGKIVDVALSKRRGRFVFTVTSIDADGKVRRRQFDAQTGKLIS